MRSISLLGSTGSIGRQTLEVIEQFPEYFEVAGLAVGHNVELLKKQIEKFGPKAVSVADKETAEKLNGTGVEVYVGQDGLKKIAIMPEADIVLVAVSGINGLLPTLAAIKARKKVALANKETLVVGGELVMREAVDRGIEIVPVDSEHCAIKQCIEGRKKEEIERIILTASGGPFKDLSKERLEQVTVAQALKHPNWSMGTKITIDSATLMNKGLEMIEAKWLFGLELEKIKPVIHPQSIVHSAVEFIDGSVIAQLAAPDMRIPIQWALGWPKRLKGKWPRLDLINKALTFGEPDMERFPCLGYAIEAGKIGGTMPAVVNATNEVAVEEFLSGKLRFMDIPRTVGATMEMHKPTNRPTLKELLSADEWARKRAKETFAKSRFSS